MRKSLLAGRKEKEAKVKRFPGENLFNLGSKITQKPPEPGLIRSGGLFVGSKGLIS
jgi:hypothetical protein